MTKAATLSACPSCGVSPPVPSPFCPNCGEYRFEGEIVGSYRCLSILGAGGAGIVYRAEHIGLSTAFAIKVLKRALAGRSIYNERFLREAKITSLLRHPHILFLADYGEIEGKTPYIATEFLEGQTLQVCLERRPILPFSQVFSILEQVCQTMRYAHGQGVVHRDLKPDNLFLLPQVGEEPFVKILDFGIARMFEDDHAKITQTGHVIGTPQYIAPEQILGQKIDHRADIFSLGILLSKMLTGILPTQGSTIRDLLQARVLQKAPLLREFHPFWKGTQIEGLLAEVLRRDPSERLSSMSLFAQGLASAKAEALSIEQALLEKTSPFVLPSDPPHATGSFVHSLSQPPQAMQVPQVSQPPDSFGPPSSPSERPSRSTLLFFLLGFFLLLVGLLSLGLHRRVFQQRTPVIYKPISEEPLLPLSPHRPLQAAASEPRSMSPLPPPSPHVRALPLARPFGPKPRRRAYRLPKSPNDRMFRSSSPFPRPRLRPSLPPLRLPPPLASPGVLCSHLTPLNDPQMQSGGRWILVAIQPPSAKLFYEDSRRREAKRSSQSPFFCAYLVGGSQTHFVVDVPGQPEIAPCYLALSSTAPSPLVLSLRDLQDTKVSNYCLSSP